MTMVKMKIGGAEQASGGGRTYQRRNPVTGAVASEAPAATVEDAVAAVDLSLIHI